MLGLVELIVNDGAQWVEPLCGLLPAIDGPDGQASVRLVLAEGSYSGSTRSIRSSRNWAIGPGGSTRSCDTGSGGGEDVHDLLPVVQGAVRHTAFIIAQSIPESGCAVLNAAA